MLKVLSYAVHVFQRDRAVCKLNIKVENIKKKKYELATRLVVVESIGTLTSLTMSIHYH